MRLEATLRAVSRKAFAGIPLPLSVMQQTAGRKFLFQPPDKLAGQAALFRADSGEVPFLAVHIINRDERRLAAHREADVILFQFGINLMAE